MNDPVLLRKFAQFFPHVLFFFFSFRLQRIVGSKVVPLASIVHLDEKRVAVKDSKNVYPVTLQLGNHDFELRKQKISKRVLAYMPVIEGVKKTDRVHVLRVHQACLKMILQPIRDSFGKWLE